MTAIELNPKTSAALLRKILKRAFPGTVFSIITARGSMVSSVRISWMDGPTLASVRAFTSPFEMGTFNGMTDSYDYDSRADRHFEVDGQMYRAGCRYVFEERGISAELANKCIMQIAAYWKGVDVLPLAVKGSGRSYTFADRSHHNTPIRPDLGRHHGDWDGSIRRCAENPAEFTWEAQANG